MIDQDAGQVIVAGFPAGEPPPALLDRSAAGQLGGFILFRRNIGDDLEALCGLNRSLLASAPAGMPPWLTLDQEGGRVSRIGAPLVQLPPMRTLGWLDRPALTRRAGALLGTQLRALGFNLDMAPVLDVDSNPENPVIGDRSFGATPQCVITHAGAFAEGLLEAGVAPCGKHFPGHGDTDLDSHLSLPRVAHDRARLDAVELAPFRALAGRLPTLMTAHVVFDALDPGVPATLSRPTLTGLLRKELGYDGVVFSDDLEMGAIRDHHGIGEAAVAAIDAGADSLLICETTEFVEQAHAALSARARADRGFARRLSVAATRSLAARRRFALDAPDPRVDAIDGLASAALQQEIADLQEAARA